MEENAKKTLLIVVSIACIAAAGILIYKTTFAGGSGGGGEITGKTWVKCNNPKCGNEYQIDSKTYSEFVMSNGGPRQFLMSGAVPMKCQKCNEDSVFKAMKCEKCGKVFFPGTVEGKADDTCPGCGYSPAEAAAKAAK